MFAALAVSAMLSRSTVTSSMTCTRDNSFVGTISLKGGKCRCSKMAVPIDKELSALSLASESPPASDIHLEDLLLNGKLVRASFPDTKVVMTFADPEQIYEQRKRSGGGEGSGSILVSVDWRSNAGESEQTLKLRFQPGRSLTVAFLEAARHRRGERMARFVRKILEDHDWKLKTVAMGCISLTFSSSDPDFQEKLRDPETLDKVKRDFVQLFLPAHPQEELLADMDVRVLPEAEAEAEPEPEPQWRRGRKSGSVDSGACLTICDDESDDGSDISTDDESDDESRLSAGRRRDLLGNGRFIQIGLVNNIIVVEFTKEALEHMRESGTDDCAVLKKLVGIHWERDERKEGSVKLKLYFEKEHEQFIQTVLEKLREHRAEHLAEFVDRQYKDLRAQLTAVSTGCISLIFSGSQPGLRRRVQENLEKIKTDFINILQLGVSPETVCVKLLEDVSGDASSARKKRQLMPGISSPCTRSADSSPLAGARGLVSDEHSSSGAPTDEVFSFLAERLGSEWLQVAFRLGTPADFMEQLHAEHQHNEQQQILKMLRLWRKRCVAKKEAPHAMEKTLLRVLREAGRTDIVSEYENRYGGRSCHMWRVSSEDNILATAMSELSLSAPTDKAFNFIAERLGTEWTEVSVNLGTPPELIERLQTEHRDNTHMQIMKMFRMWRKRCVERKEPPPAMEETLLRALREAGRTDVILEYRRYRDRVNPEQKTSTDTE